MQITYPGLSIVKIKQIYTRAGRIACHVAIPTAILNGYGWKPGQFLVAYPTKDGALKLMPQDMARPADFNPKFKPGLDELKPTKKGSWAEVEDRSIRRTEDLLKGIEEMAGSRKRRSTDDDDASDPVADEVLGEAASRRPSRQRSQQRRSRRR